MKILLIQFIFIDCILIFFILSLNKILRVIYFIIIAVSFLFYLLLLKKAFLYFSLIKFEKHDIICHTRIIKYINKVLV